MGDQNKEDRKGLLTRHAFLDTDAYHRVGYDLSHVTLETMRRYIREDHLVLHTTDITKDEIAQHLREEAAEVVSAANRASRRIASWHKRFGGTHSLSTPLDPDAISVSAIRRFDLRLRFSFDALNHHASASDAKPIFDRYFKRAAPFDHARSKEFPDAFVVAQLAKWCINNKASMYLVTNDRAMQRAANATGVLHPIDKLEDLLQLVTEAETPDAMEIVEHALADPTIIAPIQNFLNEHIPQIGFAYSGDLVEGEVQHVEVSGSSEVKDFSILSANAESFLILIAMALPLTAEVSYENRDRAVYDKEDDVFYGAESAFTEIEFTPIVKASCTLDRASNTLGDFYLITSQLEVSENRSDD